MERETAFWLIRIVVAITMIAFGVDQLRFPDQWSSYIPDNIKNRFGEKLGILMRNHAIVNIVIGIFLLSGFYPLIAAILAFVWFATIVPFAFKKDWRIGMRDLSIAASLAALVILIWKS